jgi:microcystin degradation protein MlrC
MTRIAIGGFLHESHSFAPNPTTYADFVRSAGFPPLTEGDAMLDAVRGTSVPAAGALAIAEAEGATVVPLAWTFANPAGPVQDEAFERIAALICAALSRALDAAPLDGVYLDLHGAAVVESFPDAEGELLRRVRAIVGDLPLTISLDPHANLTARMVTLADAVVPFRTYPHIDMKDAGAQAMRLLLRRIARGTPWARAYRQLEFWLPLGSQCTLLQPMSEVMAERTSLADRMEVAELAFCFGFPYADFPDCGAAVAAFADTQDNPGGGGHGDTTGLLAELVRQQAKGAVLCLINDAASVAACAAAGEGGTLALALGGKSDGLPFECSARVLKLTDGRFTLTGPMGAGNPGNLGPCALIDIDGVRVMVVSHKMQALDQAILRHVGVEPSECPILVLKSSVHFRADFAPIAERIIVGVAPGPVVADPAILNFRYVRPEVRRRPRTG